MSKVSIIIPVYNGYRFLKALLTSILENTLLSDYEVIIVDDCSDKENLDPLYSQIEKRKNFRVVRNERNMGFARSNNIGINHSDSKYVYLINSDTLVLKGWLKNIVDFFESRNDNKLAAVQSKIILATENGENNMVQTCGATFDNKGSPIYLYHRWPVDSPEVNQVFNLDSFMGCGVLLKRSVFKKMQGFDENYGKYYFEDTDLALRMKESGYYFCYYPFSEIIHFHAMTTSVYIENHKILKDNLRKSYSVFRSKWPKERIFKLLSEKQ